jgi:DNA-binding CsgD family transcriptional regulator
LSVTDEPFAVVADKGIWLWATDIAPARLEALTTLGRVEEAEALTASFAAGLRGRNASAPRAGLASCRAVLAMSCGELDHAAELHAHAAAAWHDLPRPYEALLARERQAECLLAIGRTTEGLSLLSGVFQGMCDLGVEKDAQRAIHALRRHGVNVRWPQRGGRPSYGDQLSPRELDVIRLLIVGRSNREIAETLVVSPQTVASHVRSAMRKLNAPSRTALAVRAVELGHVPPGCN